MDWRDSQSKYSVTSGVEESEGRSKLRPPKRKQYKPLPTSPSFLISVFCTILACIVLIELLIHNGTKDVDSGAKTNVRVVHVAPRQDDSSISICTEYATQTIYTTIMVYGAATTGVARRDSGNRKRQVFLETFTTNGTLTTATYTGVPTETASAYGSLSSPAATCQSTTTLSETIIETVAAAYPSLTTPEKVSPVESSTALSDYPSLTTPIITTPTLPDSAYPSLTTSIIPPAATVFPSLATPVITLTYPSLTKANPVASGFSKVTATALTSQNLPTQISPSNPSATTSLSTMSIEISALTSNNPTSAGTQGGSIFSNNPTDTSDLTTVATSNNFVVYTSNGVTTTVFGQTSSTSSVPTGPTSAADSSLTQSELRIGKNFSKLDYFNAMYLPTLLAVILKSVWVVVFASTKMMEPFHQLSKPRGATAEDTLFADYLSTGLSLSSVKAVFQGHWVMALTTIIYVLFALAPSLASICTTVKFLAKCPSDIGTVPCGPAWIVDVSAIRGIEILLGAIAVMVLALVVLQWKRKSGVMSDPSSIASMASLLHHPDVLTDFREIDAEAKGAELSNALAGNQYILGTYENNAGQYRYGLIKTVGTVKMGGSSVLPSARYQALSNPSNNDLKSTAKSIPWEAIHEVALGLSLLCLLGVCIGYYLDHKSDSFNNFFNSDTFGPRFLLVIVATVLDYQWKRIEREVRIVEPFRRLSRRMVSAPTTILPSRAGTPFSALPSALWNMNFFGAAIAVVAILSDILILAIAGVPFTSAEIKPASLASFYISFGILSIMLIALLAIIIWRRQNPAMPRPPDTLASVWTYLCASNMLEELEGLEFVTQGVRAKSIRGAGRNYFYGMATGSDGKERYMVDHERSGVSVFY